MEIAKFLRDSVGRVRRATLVRIARAASASPLEGISLTFDDGPHPEFTPQILDILGESGSRATFFVVGECAIRNPDIVRRILRDGHALGTHSMTHANMRHVGASRARSDVRAGRATVEAIVGAPVCLFRPPMGRLTLPLAAMLHDEAWMTRLWNVDSYDWKLDATPSKILEACRAARDGDVVLLHDNIPSTVEGTRLLVEHLVDNGRKLRAISI